MLCCNLTVDGKVNGDVYLLSGNLKIDVHADVEGEVGVQSGNLMRLAK
jgi:cytoskeletal protein CcmA (bactofilin family)